jgi:DNA-binding NtrC family response regulator
MLRRLSDMPEYRILVVDDDLSTTDFLREILEGQGYVVQTAASPDDAKEHMWNDLTLIWSDMRMPNIGDGLQLLKHYREQFPESNTFYAMASGTWTDAEMALARELGANEIIEKPIMIETIIKVTQRAEEFYQERTK